MRRIISSLCSIVILLNISSAIVVVEKDILKQEIIPIYFTADKDEIQEYIDLSEYENVKILDYGMNKGEAIIELEDDSLSLDLYDGEYVIGEQVREKVKTEKIDGIFEKSGKYYFEPSENVTDVIGVEGDFESGTIKNNQIILKIKDDVVGDDGHDTETIIKSEFTVEIDENNTKESVYSNYYKLDALTDDTEIKFKEINLNADASIEVNDDEIRVLFQNGTPKKEEVTKVDGYTYFWIDRALDGTFREKYPNSVYRTDRYYFEGRGECVAGEDVIMDIEFDETWKDYVGFVLDDQKYVYLLNESVSEKIFDDCIIMDDSSIDFSGIWLNTEELSVDILDNVIRFSPKGILYSMGELVTDSKDWGETVPNNIDESKESFFNKISGRMETYVKHFKFFYGPKTKEVFGGYLKYPYKAVIEYEHYKPVKLYNGTITYKYEDIEDVSGYLFDGWIKISYTEKEKVNDYPPTAPFNVFYNNLTSELAWIAAKDDYTSKEDLIYEIELKINGEFQKISEIVGQTNLKYENGKDCEFRVRAKDEHLQISEWAYSNDSDIQVVGKIDPRTVKPGDIVDISAVVKSLNEIEKVYAVSEELKIEEELLKQSEKIPNATEITFNLLNRTGKKPQLIVDDAVWARVDSNREIKTRNYATYGKTEGSTINVKLPDDINFTENGTIILPNQNYTNIPLDVTIFNDALWYFYSNCNLKFINKNTGEEESLIQFVNDNEVTYIGRREKVEVMPYLKINLFEYINGKPQYEKIPLITELAGKPIAITWATDNEMTLFKIIIEGNEIYNYKIPLNNLINNIEKFSTYSIGRTMYRMLRSVYGYMYHINLDSYSWAKMYRSNDILNIPFLGYKVNVIDENYEKYNNLTTTRDVNRLIFLDESISNNIIELYLSKIKSTNLLIKKWQYETVFAKDIQELTSEFEKTNIRIPNDARSGTYNIIISAVDTMGNFGVAIVPLTVEKSKVTEIRKEDINIGRFLYVDNDVNRKAVEELSLTKNNLQTEGFISAGETLAIVFDKKLEVNSIVVDIEGDRSIKEYDKLTELFLEKNPEKYGAIGNIEKKYKFPVTLLPNEEGVFLYTIPYGTKQTLESWFTLREKTEDYEDIDNNLLFSRIDKPYKINILIDGDEDNVISFEFDVFERWDTILNRDASKYIINSGKKWRINL